MLNKILIANRGEIACRVMRTAQRLGVTSVSVFSDADRFSKHVKMSDESFHIGGSTPLESYLDMERVLEAALKSGSEAIHPGYGFLSENPHFVDLCEQNGVKFIGPSSDAMIKMASKSESQKIMINAGVPVVPGYHGDNQDPEFLLEEAKKINFPVMIKAVMGGGGQGMRISHNADDFFQNLESAKRESAKAFKDDRVLIETYVTRPKHYEIQVIGDEHGNYAYLFERDCSIQRRHQKVIEEAPSGLTPEQRKDMGEKAVAAARAVNYSNAGTVEFLYDLDSEQFYFLEMNVRIQVEHPISEEITGVDLVEWQLKIAAGQELPMKQEDLRINGHAIEARIYSEDPFTFLPGRGTIDYYKEPLDARVDSGVELNSDVGIFYDPMISKLIVWGEDRSIAVQKLRKALVDYKIGGLVTNIPFLGRVVAAEDFKNFDYDLKFIEDNFESLVPEGIEVGTNSLIATAFLNSFYVPNGSSLPSKISNFRLNHCQIQHFNLEVKYAYSTNESAIFAHGSITNLGSELYNISFKLEDDNGKIINTEEYEGVRLSYNGNQVSIEIEGSQTNLHFYEKEEFVHVFDRQGNCFRARNLFDVIEQDDKEEIVDKERINAPMSGMVVKVNVVPGQEVKKGDIVAIMEAMKMEQVIKASFDLVVAEVYAKENSFVEAGQPILKIST